MKKILLLFTLISAFIFCQNTEKQKEVAKIYNSKMFYNDEIFLKDLEGAVKYGVVDYNDKEIECLGYYIGKMKADGKLSELRKYKYEEIFWFSEAECMIRNQIESEKQDSIKIASEKPVIKPSYKEANQYIQVNFSKNKQGISFNDLKIVEGDHVNFDIKNTLQEQINKDFSNDKNGTYTAFYDVFYINDLPKKIKIKTRLNR